MMGETVSEYHLWLLLLTQGTACIALGLAGSQLLKHHAARAHQVLLIALLASVLMPVAHLGVRHFELGVLPAPVPGVPEPEMFLDAESVAATPAIEEVKPVEATVEESISAPLASGATATAAELPWRRILLMCWATAALVLTARLALRFFLGVSLLRNARPVDAIFMRRALHEACQRMGVTGPVDLRVNHKVCSPVIWCWSRFPTLLVQTDTSENTRRHDWVGVFCHELAHLKRGDHASGLLAELLICLAPWHPLLWWARKQLLRFSEEACDDWVLAGGRNGVDYAESLLELSPQPELAFVPTVVGKEKTMKARIRRIVEEKCGVPNIGRRWATVVTVLVLGLTIGVAFAQRRPAERPRAERAEQRELMMAGRRNVLSRLLEQLVDQTREIEAALRQRGDDPGPDGTVMRAELDALHEQIGIIERQLGALERRDRPRPEFDAPQPREEQSEEIEVHTRQLDRRQDELTEQAGRLEVELRELQEGPPESRQFVEQELQSVHERLEAVEQERARGAEVRRRSEEAARARAENARMRELTQHLRELQRHARETERNLDRTDDKDSIEARELRANLDTTHEDMARIEQELSQLRTEAARADAERPTRSAVARAASGSRRARTEAPRREGTLRQAQEDLMAQIRETEEKLRVAREEDRPEAERFQRQLEQELSRLRAEAARAEAERATRSAVARATAGSRRARAEAPRREGTLRQAQEGLLAQIRMTEEKLKAAREEDSPAAERLQRVLEQLHERRESLEREADTMNDAPRERPSRNPDVERQVEELRGQMNGMHEEMAQMRAMLQQLLERSRVEREEEDIQESPVY